MSDGAPKSAVELAMERLRRQDEAAGDVSRPLTDEQKAAIADARSYCQAKIAELEILQQSQLHAIFDPAEREAVEAELRRDRDRLTAERDARIERIRRGESA